MKKSIQFFLLLILMINAKPAFSQCQPTASFVDSVGYNGWVHFKSTSTNTTASTTYSWYFGDGTPVVTGTTEVWHHYFFVPNQFLVALYAANSTSLGCMDSVGKLLSVPLNNCPVQSSFTHTVGSGGSVMFSSQSSGNTSALSYLWKFGDGTFSNQQNVTHVYQSAGNYMVQFSATQDVTCFDSLYQFVNVNNIPCVANAGFTLNPTGTPQYWYVVPNFPWNIQNAVWSWGDGSTSNYLYASHTYSAAGNYNICLTLTTVCGSTASACSTYSVYRQKEGAIVQVNVVKPQLTAIEVTDDLSTWQIFPNPLVSEMTFHSPKATDSEVVFSFYDLTGRLLLKQSQPMVGGEARLSVTTLPNGVYIVEATMRGVSLTRKVIVNH